LITKGRKFEDCKMKNSIINKDLITGINILNTLYGGSIEPSMKILQFPEYRQVEVKAPGVGEESMHVKINNNKLVIFYELKIESQGNMISVPQIVYNKAIPFFVNTDKISAEYIDGVLVVQLPYNELANGSLRDVPIKS
jgi:HSP20 family molecular chaperone IbpA